MSMDYLLMFRMAEVYQLVYLNYFKNIIIHNCSPFLNVVIRNTDHDPFDHDPLDHGSCLVNRHLVRTFQSEVLM